MKFLTTVALAPIVVAGGTIPTPWETPKYVFSNPPAAALAGYKIPTSYESAVMGRRILALTPLGDLSTTFPATTTTTTTDDNDNDGSWSAMERRPDGMEGQPIGLMDYVADCEGSGNPTLLAIRIATTFKNAAAGSNVSLSLRWTPPYPPSKRISALSSMTTWFRALFSLPGPPATAASSSSSNPPETVPYSAANLPRMSLQGYLEEISAAAEEDEEDAAAASLRSCFMDRHPDARYWLPGNRIHKSTWVRLVVEQVYWIGGFGDRAYIGWIPVDEWRAVTRDEWEAIKLPGEEKGWEEWSVAVEGAAEL